MNIQVEHHHHHLMMNLFQDHNHHHLNEPPPGPQSPDELPDELPPAGPRSPDELPPASPEPAHQLNPVSSDTDLLKLLDSLQTKNLPTVKLVKSEELVEDPTREETGVYKSY